MSTLEGTYAVTGAAGTGSLLHSLGVKAGLVLVSAAQAAKLAPHELVPDLVFKAVTGIVRRQRKWDKMARGLRDTRGRYWLALNRDRGRGNDVIRAGGCLQGEQQETAAEEQCYEAFVGEPAHYSIGC